MSIDFGGIPTFNYKGTPYARPMQVGPAGKYVVPLTFNWITYGASDNFQNIAVNIDLSGSTTQQPRQLLDQIKSVYIDNSGNPVPIYVFFPDTQFTAVAQPYSAGWYPVFTNFFKVLVVGLGFTTAQPAQTRVFLTNTVVAPYTDAALQTVLPYNLASLSIGGGAGIATITPITNGQDYNNGNLSISGGGGSGATAHGVLDQFGRFTQVIVDTPGTGYTGLPVIMPTGGQTLPPAYTGTTYFPGNHVSFNGIEYIWPGSGFSTGTIHTNSGIWQGGAGGTGYATGAQVIYTTSQTFVYECISNISPPALPPPNDTVHWRVVGPLTPDGGAPWINSGTAPGTTASFTSTLTSVARPIVSSGLALPTLGDQAQQVIDVDGGGGIRSNLWGTPFSQGFIYLKSINVKVLRCSAGVLEWNISDPAGYVIFTFEFNNTGGNLMIGSFEVLNLQGMNAKLDATQTWQIQDISHTAGDNLISHAWAWTYSLI